MSKIIISQTVKATPKQVFESYLDPKDNVRWNTAGEGWTTSHAEINPIEGGKFSIGYKSPDEKNDFDFSGTYTEIIQDQKIAYILDDGREVVVNIAPIDDENSEIKIEFETENQNSEELQKKGWCKVLNNFVEYTQRKSNPNNTILLKNILIQASKTKVWSVLLEKESYKKWTKVFTEGSYYEGEMKLNGKIKFLSILVN
jgi:uncharacterized protein YndB with AHSA1/START domain